MKTVLKFLLGLSFWGLQAFADGRCPDVLIINNAGYTIGYQYFLNIYGEPGRLSEGDIGNGGSFTISGTDLLKDANVSMDIYVSTLSSPFAGRGMGTNNSDYNGWQYHITPDDGCSVAQFQDEDATVPKPQMATGDPYALTIPYDTYYQNRFPPIYPICSPITGICPE